LGTRYLTDGRKDGFRGAGEVMAQGGNSRESTYPHVLKNDMSERSAEETMREDSKKEGRDEGSIVSKKTGRYDVKMKGRRFSRD